MGVYYSRADQSAILKITLILAPVIMFCIYWCVKYNNKQVLSRLRVKGVTVYCKVNAAYKVVEGRTTSYNFDLQYILNNKSTKTDLNVTEAEFSSYTSGDTVILRRLPDNDAPSFMKVIGFRHSGVDYFR